MIANRMHEIPDVEGPDGKQRKLPLPQSLSLPELIAAAPTPPPEIIQGLIHTGTKTILGGGSKTYKTWILMDMALSVAEGVPFWGYPTNKNRVLYLNMELQPYFGGDRFKQICTAKCIPLSSNIEVWTLRGHASPIEMIAEDLVQKAINGNFTFIVLDPIYKLLGDRDENSNGDIALMLNVIESLANRTGAAIVFGHHFAKGAQGGKMAIDRMSGAGSWARDPDTIITVTPHEEDDAFIIDMILRNHAQQSPFVVRRKHPLMVKDEEADATAVRVPGQKPTLTKEQTIEVFPEDTDGVKKSDWVAECVDAYGCGERTAERRISDCLRKGWVFKAKVPGYQHDKYFKK